MSRFRPRLRFSLRTLLVLATVGAIVVGLITNLREPIDDVLFRAGLKQAAPMTGLE